MFVCLWRYLVCNTAWIQVLPNGGPSRTKLIMGIIRFHKSNCRVITSGLFWAFCKLVCRRLQLQSLWMTPNE
jgi:hypothetical protein